MHRFLLSFFCFVGKIISDLWFDSKTSMNVPRNRDETASRSTRSSKKDHGMVMKEEERNGEAAGGGVGRGGATDYSSIKVPAKQSRYSSFGHTNHEAYTDEHVAAQGVPRRGAHRSSSISPSRLSKGGNWKRMERGGRKSKSMSTLPTLPAILPKVGAGKAAAAIANASILAQTARRMDAVLKGRAQVALEGQLSIYASIPHHRFDEERDALCREVLPYLRQIAESAGVRVDLRCIVGDPTTPMQRQQFLTARLNEIAKADIFVGMCGEAYSDGQ